MTIEKSPHWPSNRRSGVGGPLLAASQGSRNWALWLGLLVVALALLGGSSRPDPIQNAGLRPIAALLLIPALYRLRAADLANVRVMLVSGGLLLGWMILQLIPLPPALWQALPGRAEIAELDTLVGIQSNWRPVSLAPFRGLNALIGMIVPISALLLMLSARLRPQSILVTIAGLGLTNTVFGILQVIGGPESPLYLFAKTSRGAPAGIFANENHAAVFASVVLLIIARLAVDGRSQRQPAWLKFSLIPAYLLILIGVLISGSRAGLATALLALSAGGVMIVIGWRTVGPFRTGAERTIRRKQHLRLAPLAAGAAGIMLVAAVFLLFNRVPAAQDLVASNPFDDVRWSLWPVLVTMMQDHWVLGTGFGSFDVVYRMYEPSQLLLPLYVNQAHNDWAQLVIEGGLIAVAAALGVIGWLCTAIVRIVRLSPNPGAIAVFWVAWLAILMAASVIDYPLRTPIFQAVAVWLMLCVALDLRALNGAEGEQQ